jgi:sugar phosphate isomerase/epimerase
VNRRIFLDWLGRAAGACATLPLVEACGRHEGLPDAGTSGTARRLDRIGLELYAVRDAMRADPEGTMAAVREMGYDDVELLWSFGNFGRTPSQVRATLEQTGLRAPSAHIAPELLQGDWSTALDDARLLGHEYLIVPSLPAETNTSLDAWKRWADIFNAAGSTARTAGMWLAFHNEPGHQGALDGEVPYDVFVQRTDPAVVRHQLDTGNMLMGDGDPQAYLARYRDRYFSFHLKDVVADRSRDTELGQGILDIGAFLAAIPDLAAKPVYVEQEGTADAMGAARRNCAYVRALEFHTGAGEAR